jgi:hypothetical protein
VADYVPQVGDRVRVVVEGEVMEVGRIDVHISVDGDLEQTHALVDLPRDGIAWEKLPDPEPEWQFGDAVARSGKPVQP